MLCKSKIYFRQNNNPWFRKNLKNTKNKTLCLKYKIMFRIRKLKVLNIWDKKIIWVLIQGMLQQPEICLIKRNNNMFNRTKIKWKNNHFYNNSTPGMNWQNRKVLRKSSRLTTIFMSLQKITCVGPRKKCVHWWAEAICRISGAALPSRLRWSIWLIYSPLCQQSRIKRRKSAKWETPVKKI